MKRYHFIAVGGAVMHQMAILLKKQGNIVSGSDDAIFDPAKSNLQKFGILPLELGWNEDIITTDLDCIILGMHARADNPELIKAKALNIPVYSFPEFIFKQSTDKKRLVVGGSHGKTTTTAMIIHALKAKNLQFDYLVGSKLDDLDFMVDLNPENKIIVIEGDEYLSLYRFAFQILTLQTTYCHYYGYCLGYINVFPTFESYLATFKLFMESVSDTLILNKEDDELLNLEKKTDIKCPVIHYETLPFEINDGLTTIQFSNKNYNLKIFGKHNISNMASAMHACKAIGISENDFLESMQSFGGTAKRLEKIYELPEKKCTVYRDFAHAPSKVKATVAATRAQFPNRKLIAIFELHTFSSLQTDFLNEYKKSLEGADFASVYIDDEALALKRMERHTQTQLLEAFDYENLQILNHKEDILNFMNRMPMENCVYLLMSSGHLGGLNFVKWFSERINLNTFASIMNISDCLIIIPTYNEKENVQKMIETVLSISDRFDILIVEDGSPDGTADIVKEMMAKNNNRVHILERKGKLGLGTAYIAGFKWALERHYEYIFEMDCDFSHNPFDLLRLLKACEEGADLSVGSRYVKGGKVENWPDDRVFISKYASVYVRIITFMPVRDTTGGFVCYKRKVLDTIALDKLGFMGYAFQIEMKYATWRLGFKIKEIPITFKDRELGNSKMSKGIIKEAVTGVVVMRLNSLARPNFYRKSL